MQISQDLNQNLSNQIKSFDMNDSEISTESRILKEIDAGLFFSTRNIINGLKITMPEIFEAEDRSKSAILDVGCGTGIDTVILLQAAGFINSVGIDLSINRVNLGREAAKRLNIPPDCIQKCNLQDFTSKDKEFDIVIGQCIVHHFPQYFSFLQHIYSILGPSGRCLFYEPSLFPIAFFRAKYDRTTKEFFQHRESEEIYINPYKLRKILKRTGFRNIRIFSNFYHSKITEFMTKIPFSRFLGHSLYIYAEK